MVEMGKSFKHFSLNQSWKEWLTQTAVAVYLGVSILIFIAIPFLANGWLKTPFIGGFLEQTLVFGRSGPASEFKNWSAYSQGLTFSDRLLSVEKHSVTSERQIREILQQYKPGDQVGLQVQKPEGEIYSYQVELVSFPYSDRVSFLYIPYLIGWVYLIGGIWIFSIKRNQIAGQFAVVFTASMALVLSLIFDINTTHRLVHFWSLGLGLVGPSLLGFAMVFPHEDEFASRNPLVKWIGFFIGLLLVAFTFTQLFNFSSPTNYAFAWQAEYILAGITLTLAFASFISRTIQTKSTVERGQVRLILWGGGISTVPIGVWLLLSFALNTIRFSSLLLIPLAFFPLALGYAIQRYRMTNVDFILRRVVLHVFMVILVGAGYAFLVSGLGILLTDSLGKIYPFLAGAVIFLIALAINPLRQILESAVNRLFFRGEKPYQEHLQKFSSELTNLNDLAGIIKILRQEIEQSLLPNRMHIFILDTLSDQFHATQDRFGEMTSDLNFTLTSGLPLHLYSKHGPLILTDFDNLPDALQPEMVRIQLLSSHIFIPLPGREHLNGWIALGFRFSGEPYSSQDIDYLEALADQAALAIERAQVVSNLETRMRHLNVLSRVAQGINITITLDDMLELIYAQTTQVIPAEDFKIILKDEEASGVFVPIFYVENNERLLESENRPVLPETVMEKDVIQLRRPIFTDDYRRECQRRGINTEKEGLFAFMSVPLNSGAGTIGAISLGTRDSTRAYNQEQLNLFQSIADQAAGAIIKARLLQETERRARQLATLNEVTRQLTSTLEQEPLLFNILQSAVDILDCEAGSLLMVDEQTDELVFRVTVGPVALDLVDTRMPAGSGMVGKAVKTQQPVLVNDVNQAPEWFSHTDQQTGFVTRAALAIPMQVKDNVIGVIEVINKQSGLPFTQEDTDLLSAFAGQAAVAIENARLYTSTDEALAARVEELSVMQRIDRELNTSLDISRAMQITLEWSMRQSKANAGLVGIVMAEGIQIMASQGYSNELEMYQQSLLPFESATYEKAIQIGVPQHIALTSDALGILHGAAVQIAVPIRRESNTIGIIILESLVQETISEDVLNFLVRLSDHASIAISNSQLYAAVQSANTAKSEFVSFVSHELKNPMTSIKGYTELLAAGAVGPINEMQANFLTTIRSNVERMSTLVSDLADVSRIEAGRLRLNFKSVPISDVIEEVARSLKRQIDDKKQQLTVQLGDDLVNVWADRDRLLQILTNLVSNANKYTPPGGQFWVYAEVADNQWDSVGARKVVHIWVQDTGIGISPEDSKKIFQKFFRSEDPKTREAPGTGLGLNITKSLVEMMGGRIWFESEFRKGTTFHFTVPISD